MKIKLWTDNRSDQLHEIELDHLAQRFVAYDNQHRYTDSWPLERAVRCFITDDARRGGLQSVFDENQYADIHSACRRARWPEDAK